MSDNFLCMFCPTKLFFKKDLRDHIIKVHKRPPKTDIWHNLKDIDLKNRQFNEFVENLVDYCSDLETSLAKKNRQYRRSRKRLMYLPKDNVTELLVGCSLCDAIINHYKLQTFNRKDKPNRDVCICGNSGDNQFKTLTCSQCQHSYHFECYNSRDFDVNKLSFNLCKYCQTMEFVIKTVNDMTPLEQLTHIRQHLNYRPIGCLLCSKKLFTYQSFIEHLNKKHQKDNRVDNHKVFYTYHTIDEIEALFEDKALNGPIKIVMDFDIEPKLKLVINPKEATNGSRTESNQLTTPKLLGTAKSLDSQTHTLCDNQLEPIASTSSSNSNNKIVNNPKESSVVEQSTPSVINTNTSDVIPPQASTVSMSESEVNSQPVKSTTRPVSPSKSNFSIPLNKSPKELSPELDKQINDLIQLSNKNRNLFDDKNLTKIFEESVYSIELKCRKLSSEESNQIHLYLSSNIPYIRDKFSETVFKYQKKIIQKELDGFLFEVRKEMSELEPPAIKCYNQMLKKYKADQAKGKTELQCPVKFIKFTPTIERNLNKAMALKEALFRLESTKDSKLKVKDYFAKFIERQVMDCWTRGWIKFDRLMKLAKPYIKSLQKSNTDSPQKSDRSSASNASEIMSTNGSLMECLSPVETNGNSTPVKDNSSVTSSPVKRTSTASAKENDSTLPTATSDIEIETPFEAPDEEPIIVLSASGSPEYSSSSSASDKESSPIWRNIFDTNTNGVTDSQLNGTSEVSPQTDSCPSNAIQIIESEENDSKSPANGYTEELPLIPKPPHNKRKFDKVLSNDCEDTTGEPKHKKQRIHEEVCHQMDVDLAPKKEQIDKSDETNGIIDSNDGFNDSEECLIVASTSGLNSVENGVHKSCPVNQTESTPQKSDQISDKNEINRSKILNELKNNRGSYIVPMDIYLLMNEVLKFPYYPQLEDRVVYLRAGHYHYIRTLREQNLIPNKMSSNFRTHKYSSKDYKEFDYILAIVRQISFESKPFASIKLKLEELDPHDGESLGTHFDVQYHRLEGVSDFIILRSIYEKSMDQNWTVGNVFKSISPDGDYWKVGVIKDEQDFQMISKKFPNSDYKKFSVNYLDQTSDTSSELLSPWDLEPNDLQQNQKQRKITLEERLSFYDTVLSDWSKTGEEDGLKPSELRDRECERLSTAFDQLLATEMALMTDVFCCFYTQPKLVYKIDVNLIKMRIQNRFYRRSAQIMFDLNAIKSNLQSVYLDGTVRRNYEKLLKVSTVFVESQLSDKPDVFDVYTKVFSVADEEDSDDDIQDNTSAAKSLNVTTNQTMVTNGSHNESTQQTIQPMEYQSVDESQLLPEIRIKTEDLSQEYQIQSQDSNGVDVMAQIEFNNTRVIPVLIENEVQTDIQISLIKESPYFCVFCQKSTTFTDKIEATEHIKSHFGSGIQCTDCRFGYETIEEFRNKEPEHSLNPKNIERIKEFYLTLDWIDSYLDFQRTEDFNKLVRIRNEFCPVCASIKQMTVRPYIQIEDNIEDNDPFDEHIRKHLKYYKVFECIKCCDESNEQLFKFCFDLTDAQNHLESHHSNDGLIETGIYVNFRVNQTQNNFLMKNVIKKYMRLNESIDEIYDNLSICG